ncbi:hypothetical protein [Burkholderia gladioli]|uniref:hypothetical protein n=1 Tax=Burkholderia gladioli TaxID=28095 RepID=UPI00163E0DC5|nr:hypothetical protein [Burkholderia gladioli]
MTTTQQPNRFERQRMAESAVQSLLLYTGRYDEALAIIKAQFCGEDPTAIPERFNFYLENWLREVVGMIRPAVGRSEFIRALLALTPSDQDPAIAFWRVANTHGVQPDVFPDLMDMLGADLNREVALYVTPRLDLAARNGSNLMHGPLWLVLLLCVCRPTKGTSLGVLAYKKSFTEDDLAWIDKAANLAAKHGADLGLSKTVTWKRSKPVLQAMVANIEARHLRQAVGEVSADQVEPIRARGRARL